LIRDDYELRYAIKIERRHATIDIAHFLRLSFAYGVTVMICLFMRLIVGMYARADTIFAAFALPEQQTMLR